MNHISAFVARHPQFAWLAVFAVSLGMALLAAFFDLRWQERQRLAFLQTQAERGSVDIRSATLDGNLMGAINLLGLMDASFKQEASTGVVSQSAALLETLQLVGKSFDAEGVFIVASNGVIQTSWDHAAKPSTGLDVKFRPYYKMAMQGKSGIYAAVSMVRGDQSLYVTAPIFSERTHSSASVGAVVARTSLSRVDAILQGLSDATLLLSPQGVVFSSSKAQWVGMIDGVADGKRLADIRALKQFGAMFEKTDPAVLPFGARSALQTVGAQRFAVAAAAVNWNDPYGDWKLVLVEDLERSVPLERVLPRAALAASITLLLGALTLAMLLGYDRQLRISQQLNTFAQLQETNAARKMRIAAVTVQFQRAGSMDALIKVFLDEAHALYGALQGVVYLGDATGDAAVLHLAGSYACADPPAPSLEPGEGLLGQCALDRRMQIIRTGPDGFALIRSGLGETPLGYMLLAPILLNDVLLGVVELGLLRALPEDGQAAFSELVGLLAMNIEIRNRSIHFQPASSKGEHT